MTGALAGVAILVILSAVVVVIYLIARDRSRGRDVGAADATTDEVVAGLMGELRKWQAETAHWKAAAERLQRTVALHVKVDTGMGRLGVAAKEAVAFVKKVKRFDRLNLVGLYTHYASAEDDEQYPHQCDGSAGRFGARPSGGETAGR